MIMKIIWVLISIAGLILFGCEKQQPQKMQQEKDLGKTLLLSHYKPHSIYNIPISHIDKSKYPIIDMHSHPYAESPEQIALWARRMDSLNIKKTIILSMSTGARFDSIYALYSKYPNHFEVWCGFDYTNYDKSDFGPAAVAELERCVKVGARGVGELGDKGNGLFYSKPGPHAIGMHIDDTRMDPLLEKCAELNLSINIHIAEPLWMYEPMDSTNDGLMNAYEWRRDNKNDELNHSQLIKTLENALKRHPKTQFIACHFANCSYDLNILGRLLDLYPNFNADISARYAETAPIPRFVKAFYEKYQDRLFYGTDMGFDRSMYEVTFRILESQDEHFYEIDQFGYHWALNGFGLSDQVLAKVYSGNAQKIISR
jgi:predicted TIM-barrel fold metal-dependent hydrolase